jgi:hypothetical protein
MKSTISYLATNLQFVATLQSSTKFNVKFNTAGITTII